MISERMTCRVSKFVTIGLGALGLACAAAAYDVPRFFTATDNEPLTGGDTFYKTGAGILWLVSPSNNTFSGDIVIERGGGALLIGANTLYAAGDGRAGLALPAMTAADNFTVRGGGTLYLHENGNGYPGHLPGRLGQPGDRPGVILEGGMLFLNGINAANFYCTQFVGQVSANTGMSTLQVYRNNGTPVLCADSLTIADDAYLSLGGTSLGTAAANVSQLFLDTPPYMIGGGGGDGTTSRSVIPAARFGNDLVTYGTYGVRPAPTRGR